MSLPSSNLTFLHASPACVFMVDGRVFTEFMPVGLPAKRLEVKMELVRNCDKMLPPLAGLDKGSGAKYGGLAYRSNRRRCRLIHNNINKKEL